MVYPPGQGVGARKERHIKVLQSGDIITVNMAVKVTSGLADTKQQILKARLHCVDVTTRELVYAWLFEIEADKPMVQRAYQIPVVVGRHTPYKFPFANPLSQFVMLEFVSSKPAIMEVRMERQSFEANESKHVELFVPPLIKAGQTEEVIMYVNDQAGKVSESLLFKIVVKDK